MRKAIRKFLKLDTWGMDILRLKRRLGTTIQNQSTIVDWSEVVVATLYEQQAELRQLRADVAALQSAICPECPTDCQLCDNDDVADLSSGEIA